MADIKTDPLSAEQAHASAPRPIFKYDYLPAGHIRIIVLQPGTGDDPLHSTLETVRLDKKSRYDGISYAWGPAVFRRILYVSGSYLKITESLHGALRRFRNESTSVRLWADAVCIGQATTDEKNHQVKDMSMVYENAGTVLVWLGEAVESEAVAFSIFQRVPPAVSKKDHNLFSRQVLLAYEDAQCRCCSLSFPKNWPKKSDEDPNKSSFRAIMTVLRKPWFVRLWVVQECATSRAVRFHCGSHWATRNSIVNTLNMVRVNAVDCDPVLFSGVQAAQRSSRNASNL